MSRYCLDTSAYSNFKRGEPRVIELLDKASWIGVPSIVLGELAAGFEKGSHRDRNFAELEEFLEAPVIQVLPLDKEAAFIFGVLVKKLKDLGKPIPTNDIWISAICAACGATLITYDDHFRNVERIGVVVLEAPAQKLTAK